MVIAWMSGDVSDAVDKDRAPSVSSDKSRALKRVFPSSWRGTGAANDLLPEPRGGGVELPLHEASVEA
ncbi:MAG TPA: hypothetical protein VGN19_05420 [Pedococcus sp.]|jgi:hypothetical protein|nr:hypothetical protein [Pedococcus sp.]